MKDINEMQDLSDSAAMDENEEQITYQLNHEMNNIREALQEKNIEPIGNLFRHEPENIR